MLCCPLCCAHSTVTKMSSSWDPKQELGKVSSTSVQVPIEKDDDDNSRRAVEELLQEARIAKERAEEIGTSAWRKRKFTTNKRFLQKTLFSSINANLHLNKSFRDRNGISGHTSSQSDIPSPATTPPLKVKTVGDTNSRTKDQTGPIKRKKR